MILVLVVRWFWTGVFRTSVLVVVFVAVVVLVVVFISGFYFFVSLSVITDASSAILKMVG